MDPGTVFSVVQALMSVLDSRSLRDFASAVGVKKKINKLRSTLSAINAVRLDADERGMLTHADRDWLQKLRDVVYEAEDVVDEFNTRSQQQQIDKPYKFLKKVCDLLPSFKLLALSQKIDNVIEQLDDIAKERQNYGNTHHFHAWEQIKPVIRRDTLSFVNDKDVIGRDDDKKAVIDMLLDSNNHVEENLSCVSIVGIGGLGKTTLAQLVFNDRRVESEFTRKIWVCVSEDFDTKSLLERILKDLTKRKPEDLDINQLHSQLREKIVGERVLLVLDDVWKENHHEWLKFRELFFGVGRGSRILVTTRSKDVAKVTGDYPIYELSALSDDQSWNLFQKVAFGFGRERLSDDDEFVETGREIVKKCANIPLAIKTIGSLLYGQSKSKWVSLKNIDMATIKQGEDDIIPTLKLSYYYLPASLKRCFVYCALFPKDYVIYKDVLIQLWMAQGYIEPSNNECPVDIGNEYFEILLQRCFFQNEVVSALGEIQSCKIHDLMHDLAMNLASEEGNLFMNHQQPNTNLKKIRHISFDLSYSEIQQTLPSFGVKSLRTFLQLRTWREYHNPIRSMETDAIISNCNCLRVLDLNGLQIADYPSSIGKLIHLRYLDLSRNEKLISLPNSIIELRNLQTLKLEGCSSLEQLPRRLHRLVNLVHLDILDCDKLKFMPPRLDNMTSLNTLSMFVVGGSHSNLNSADIGQLQDLKDLNNLRGEIEIVIAGCSYKIPKFGVACLGNKQYLEDLSIKYEVENMEDSLRHEALLEHLQPHPNLRELSIYNYPGESLPSWLPPSNLKSFLPKLVAISLSGCKGLQVIPSFHQLLLLKTLQIWSLTKLEYMENACFQSTSMPELQLFFPALEELYLEDLPNLRGWWRRVKEGGVVGDGQQQQQQQGVEEQSFQPFPSFPSLSFLHIEKCPNLISMPLCPRVDELSLFDFNERLSILKQEEEDVTCAPSSSSIMDSTSSQPNSSLLKTLHIDNSSYLMSLPQGCLQCLSNLEIQGGKIESLLSIEEVIFQSMSSLPSLNLNFSFNLKTLLGGGGGFKYLTSLETLKIQYCKCLDLEVGDGDDDMWKPLGGCLRSLSLWGLPRVKTLPKGLVYLSSLQSLNIWDCPELKSLPETMRELTSLKRLEIRTCPDLKRRCREPDAEDWPKIQHIPDRVII